MRVRIRKWYLDCSASGNVAAVVYVGRVSVGWLSAPYAEILVRGGGAADLHVKRVSASSIVSELPDRISIEAPALGVSGNWTRRAPEVGATLIDARATRIEWRCRLPRADVELHLPDGRVLEGAGYVEHLSLDGTTAGLPFRQLRWGRFIGGHRHAVWIDWDDGLAGRWVFVDGLAVDATVVTNEVVAWPGGRLEIDAGFSLRHARVAETVGGRFGRWLPRKLAGAMESKWAGPARLIERSTTTDGQVIHEVVRWS